MSGAVLGLGHLLSISVIRSLGPGLFLDEMPARTTPILILLAATSIGVMAPSAPAHAGFTEVSPSILKFEGIRYWRTKASEAKLGSVGRKMTPVDGRNYFQKVQDAPTGIYDVTIDGHTTITTKEAREWGVTPASSNVAGTVGGSGEYEGTLTAYKMRIDLGNARGDLRYETNRHANHLRAVKNEGDRARLIAAVWILVAADESKHECYSGDLTITDDDVSVRTTAAGCSTSSWVIEPESIVAYEMVKVDDWNDAELSEQPTCPASHPAYESRSSPTTPMDRCKRTTYDYVSTQCQLTIFDKRENWYVESRDGRDTCKSRKGKPDKDVECSAGGYTYVAQSGRDTCRKPEYSYTEPVCPTGYDYDRKSTSNGGVDRCELRGIASLKPDTPEGF